VSNRIKDRRGIALLMTILVISALAAIATPFVLSMRIEHEQAKSYVDLKRARDAARAAIQDCINVMYSTYPAREYLNNQNPADPPEDPDENSAGYCLPPLVCENTPDYDGLEEILPRAEYLTDVIHFVTKRRPNVMISTKIVDENSKININTATPTLLSNLLGVSQAAEDLEYNASEIPLLDSSPFFSDGYPDTYDGIVRIGGEFIAYRHIDRENHILLGCDHGVFEFNPQRHPEGALVQDARGYKIWEHSVCADLGRLTMFETPAAVREIANWTKFGGAFLLDALLFRKIYTDQLRKYGIDDEQLRGIGIDPDTAMKPKWEPTPEERRQIAETDRKLKDLGLDPDLLRGFASERRLGRWADRISRMKNQKRQKQWLDGIKKRQEQLREQIKEREERAKKFFPSAFKALKDLLVERSKTQLETLRAIEYEKIRPFITTSSVGVTKWLRPARLTSKIPQEGAQNQDVLRRFYVSDRTYINRGTLLKIVQGGVVEYAVVEKVTRNRIHATKSFQNIFEPGALVYPAARQPINVNTASPEVLMAVLTGLKSKIKPSNQDNQSDQSEYYNFITPEDAGIIAEAIYNRVNGAGGFGDQNGGTPLTGHADLHSLLSGLDISERNKFAVLINAMNPNSGLLAYSTTGFTYRTHDAYTIEGTGIVFSPTGPPRARCTIREVIDVAPPEVHEWAVDSQADFTHGVVLRQRSRTIREWLSYPGRSAFKLDTRPNQFSIGGNYDFDAILNCFPDTSHDPDKGSMRLETLYVSDPSDKVFSEHFDGRINGATLQTSLATNNFPTFSANRGEFIGPGYYQAWVRPNSAGGYTFFEYGEDEYQNRIRFAFDGMNFVFEIADATLDRKLMRTTGQLDVGRSIQAGVWYHVAACWRGPRVGETEIYLDGKAIGETDTSLFTRLKYDISENDFNIQVDSIQGLPNGGVILVGDEIIEYTVIDASGALIAAKEAKRIWVPWSGDPPLDPTKTDPNDWRRLSWCRGTSARPHVEGEMVTIYGYSNTLDNEVIPKGDAYIADGHFLQVPTPQTVVVTGETEIDPNTGIERAVDLAADDPIVKCGNTSQFPPDGVIKIDDEKIFYRYKSTDNASFTGCERGVLGTFAVPHRNGSRIDLISLRVTDNRDYKNEWFIQVNNEWLYVEKYIIQAIPIFATQYFILPYDGHPGADRPIMLPDGTSISPRQLIDRNLSRGRKDTVVEAHGPNTPVIPVFKVKNPYCGPYDVVTVVDEWGTDPSEKIPMIIKHAANAGPGQDRFGGRMAAFTNFVPRKIEIKPFGRILKWPSGEMPRMTSGGQIQLGQPVTFANSSAPAVPQADANVDELIIAKDDDNFGALYAFVQRGCPVGDADLQIYVRAFANNPSIGGIAHIEKPKNTVLHLRNRKGREYYGLIKIGDEVMVVTSTEPDPNAPMDGNRKIMTVVRGSLGTAAADHDELDPVWSLPWPAVGVLAGPPQNARLQGDFSNKAPTEGYIQVERGDRSEGYGEFIPYKYRRGNLRLFEDVNQNEVGRCAFGTQELMENLVQDTPVIFKPARYWDIYTPRRESIEIVHLARAQTIRGSHFRRLYWKQRGRPGTKTIVLLRFDGKPAWTAKPTNKPGGIYKFTKPKNPPDGNLIGITADTVEMKVHMTYRKGAYSTDDWKDTPIIRGIYLEYERPVQVLSSEEITK